MQVQSLAFFSSTFERNSWDFFQVDERNEDLTEDNLILSEDLAEDCLSVQDVISCVNPERSNNLLYNLHVLATISFLSYNLLS